MSSIRQTKAARDFPRLVTILLASTILCAAQSLTGVTKLAEENGVSPALQHQSTGSVPGVAGSSDLDSFPSPFRDSTRQKLNADRQKKLVNDTQRLLVLANQLKAETTASGTDSATPEMLRQMDEIEKLARSVKEKMRS